MIKVDEQAQWWAGEAGNEYTRRNSKVDWRLRIPFWHDIMKFTGARSVYEVGCGAGFNLSAIREASPHRVQLYGCDINDRAVSEARLSGFEVENGTAFERMGGAELVFTAGTLIHVAPENLEPMMRLIIGAASRWVLAVEYFSEAEEMIEYRGQKDRLWKRNYGALYEAMQLSILHTGSAVGFDRCIYWLLGKNETHPG